MEDALNYKFGILLVKKDLEQLQQVDTLFIFFNVFITFYLYVYTITLAYYRGAMGILLVYDVTDDKSFGNIRNWIRNIEQHATESVNKMLIGNKCDMVDKKVSFFFSNILSPLG